MMQTTHKNFEENHQISMNLCLIWLEILLAILISKNISIQILLSQKSGPYDKNVYYYVKFKYL